MVAEAPIRVDQNTFKDLRLTIPHLDSLPHEWQHFTGRWRAFNLENLQELENQKGEYRIAAFEVFPDAKPTNVITEGFETVNGQRWRLMMQKQRSAFTFTSAKDRTERLAQALLVRQNLATALDFRKQIRDYNEARMVISANMDAVLQFLGKTKFLKVDSFEDIQTTMEVDFTKPSDNGGFQTKESADMIVTSKDGILIQEFRSYGHRSLKNGQNKYHQIIRQGGEIRELLGDSSLSIGGVVIKYKKDVDERGLYNRLMIVPISFENYDYDPVTKKAVSRQRGENTKLAA